MKLYPLGRNLSVTFVPSETESSVKYLIDKFERHWIERGVVKIVEQRGADEVTLWKGLDQKYAMRYRDALAAMKMKAWLEGPAGAKDTTAKP
jgi:hypothetical protein